MENRNSSDGSDSGENERKTRKRKTQENNAQRSPGPREEVRDDFAVFGEHVAIKLRNLQDPDLQCLVQHQIHNALYNAEVKRLSRSRKTDANRPSTSSSVGRTMAPPQPHFEVPCRHGSATSPLIYRASYSYNSTITQPSTIPIVRPSHSGIPPLMPVMANAPIMSSMIRPYSAIVLPMPQPQPHPQPQPQPQPDVVQPVLPVIPAPADSSRPVSPTAENDYQLVSPIPSVTISD